MWQIERFGKAANRAVGAVTGTGIGLAPLLQWVLLPLLTVWFTRRQLASAQEAATL